MNKEIIIYTTDDGKAKINLQKEHGTVWLSQTEIAELFQTTKQNISKRIKAIFDDGELNPQVVVNYKLTTTRHGAMPDKVQSKKNGILFTQHDFGDRLSRTFDSRCSAQKLRNYDFKRIHNKRLCDRR